MESDKADALFGDQPVIKRFKCVPVITALKAIQQTGILSGFTGADGMLNGGIGFTRPRRAIENDVQWNIRHALIRILIVVFGPGLATYQADITLIFDEMRVEMPQRHIEFDRVYMAAQLAVQSRLQLQVFFKPRPFPGEPKPEAVITVVINAGKHFGIYHVRNPLRVQRGKSPVTQRPVLFLENGFGLKRL